VCVYVCVYACVRACHNASYLHVPPFEDGGQDGAEAEASHFIQGAQQLHGEREERVGEGQINSGYNRNLLEYLWLLQVVY